MTNVFLDANAEAAVKQRAAAVEKAAGVEVVAAVTARLAKGSLENALLDGLARPESALAAHGVRAQPGDSNEISDSVRASRSTPCACSSRGITMGASRRAYRPVHFPRHRHDGHGLVSLLLPNPVLGHEGYATVGGFTVGSSGGSWSSGGSSWSSSSGGGGFSGGGGASGSW